MGSTKIAIIFAVYMYLCVEILSYLSLCSPSHSSPRNVSRSRALEAIRGQPAGQNSAPIYTFHAMA